MSDRSRLEVMEGELKPRTESSAEYHSMDSIAGSGNFSSSFFSSSLRELSFLVTSFLFLLFDIGSFLRLRITIR